MLPGLRVLVASTYGLGSIAVECRAGAVVYSRVPSGGGSVAGWQHSARVTQKHRLWPGFYWPRVWGLSGGTWWLPLSHRVVRPPDSPSVTSASAQETTSSVCDPLVTTVGVPSRSVCQARCRSPPHHYCAPVPVQQPPRCSRRPRVLLALPAASPSIGIQTWRIRAGGVGERQVRADFMMTLSPNFRPWMGGCYGPSPAADSSREWRWHVLLAVVTNNKTRWACQKQGQVCSIPGGQVGMLQTHRDRDRD
jgi:hypothetical protein